jgi:hypothetical protein
MGDRFVGLDRFTEQQQRRKFNEKILNLKSYKECRFLGCGAMWIL